MAPDQQDNSRPHPSADELRRALRRYATEFLLLLTTDGRLIASSEIETLGYPNDYGGRHIGEFVHPDDLPGLYDAIEEARKRGAFGRSWRARVRRADGSWGVFEGTLIDVEDDPLLDGSVLRVREVTDELGEAGRDEIGVRFHSLAEALPLGILCADARGWVVFCNAMAEQILGLPADELKGRGWERTIHREDRLEVVAAAGNAVTLGIDQQVTFRLDREDVPRWAHARFVALGADRDAGWIATIEDITERRRAESELAHQATHDALTGLPNRVLLYDRIRQACGRLRRGSDAVSVVFIDLNGFKAVNDTHGHRTGDAVLVEVGNRLRQVVRTVDTVARFAGDEFVVVCESITDDALASLLQRIREAIAVPMLFDGANVAVDASIGVATTHDPRADVEELIMLADQQMYREKRAR
ncbi:MAG: GGDEF domain-containing protein [Acidimicrobiales bacterium]